jgi:hypothetical protein
LAFSDVSSLGQIDIEEASAHLLPIPDERRLLSQVNGKLPRKERSNLQTMVPVDIV